MKTSDADVALELCSRWKARALKAEAALADRAQQGEPVAITGAGLQRFLIAHMRNIHAEYQHRMAGMAYLMSRVVTITPIKE